ncbi:hypothetical protein KM043_005912 [Ampulex compressa]|nr:hypothetical protein KM043_005912 [Ampulex compressa]
MLENAKNGRFLAGFCAAFIQSSVFSFYVAKVISPDLAVVGNESAPLPPYAFYDDMWGAKYTPPYEVVIVMQCLSTFVVNCITAGTYGLAIVFVMHARGQLKIVTSWLEHLVDDEKKESRAAQKRLGAIVQQHQRVLSFAARIEEILHMIALVEVLGCTLLMCILGYCGITEWNLNERENILSYCSIFISVTFNIFVFCYVGEILSDECSEVGEVAYMTEWYDLPDKTALGLILIILRSSTIVKMTAGKMLQLSLPTFMDVLKMSLSYLNMLRAVTTNVEV